MHLLMTLGTGLGTDITDAKERLIHITSFLITQYDPHIITLFCSSESREIIPDIAEGCKIRCLRDLPPYNLVIIPDPHDFDQCFDIIFHEADNRHDEEIIINGSTGTRAMITAAEIVSFLTGNPLGYVSGSKSAGMIIPGTERIKQMDLYAAYDHLQFRRAIEQFNQTHYGSALGMLNGITTIPERDLYYGLISSYYYWDKLNYPNAFRYIKNSPSLTEMVTLNKEFLTVLLDLDEREERDKNKKQRMQHRQQKYLYILVDLLNNAKRRIYRERYDDAVARLYRVVELLSQVLLLNYGIDDNEDKIHFSDVRKLLPDKQMISSYARRADRHGILKIGLRYKFTLLEDLGMAGAESYYQRLSGYLSVRNDSILAHGLTPVPGDLAREMWDEVYQVCIDACEEMPLNLVHLVNISQYPVL